ncbi:MAG: UbiA family prenyltransferase [Gemmatimonadales bacterium]
MTRIRTLGYRILGSKLDYLLHLRPAEWPIVSVHFLTGSALAGGLGDLLSWPPRGGVVLGLLLWVIALNGGTLALNSAFDRDTGDIAYLRSPPPPPPGLAAFGLALMLAGAAVAATLSLPYALAFWICVGLSILYSAPPLRLKGVAGADWLVNMAGFGFLTAFAGYVSTGTMPGRTGWLLLAGFALLFGALYPMTQLYQLDEDARRGDRTLAVALGPERSLGLAGLALLGAFALFAAATVAWWSAADRALRGAGLALAFGAWIAVILPWRAALSTQSPADHRRRMHRALAVWALTDAAVLHAWGR